MKKINVLRRENTNLLSKTGKYDDLKAEVKEKLAVSTEIQTIKFLRIEKGLSIVEAKKW